MTRLGTVARRTFLIGSAALLGGVAFGVYAYRRPYPNPIAGTISGAGIGAITPYVLIDPQGVTIITPRAEMGQGVHSTLAALVAEELDLPWHQVRVMHGPPAAAYYNAVMLEEGVPFAPTDESWLAETARSAMAIPAKFLALQVTGGSTSIPDGYEKMRAAGAVARAALVQAAARRLGVSTDTLSTKDGAVIAADGTRIPYTDLAVDAAHSELPAVPPLKPRENWTLLGTSLPRIDMVEKSTGTAQFAGDIRLPGMRFATVRMNPAIGAAMTGFDATAALALPGVEQVIDLGRGIAVVANTTWAAMQGADAIRFDWAAATYPATSAGMRAQIAEAFSADTVDATARNDGDVTQPSGQSLQAEYHVPPLAHATMEPMQATAYLQDGRLEIWVGTQAPGFARKAAAKAAGVPEENVALHTTLMGGGFGRRSEVDATVYTAQVAAAIPGTPVLVTWSREEDMTQGPF
ncbi:MAG: molybdopterin cofactor-binding domain-containing protein, partial [Paracoccaceae bacterium]